MGLDSRPESSVESCQRIHGMESQRRWEKVLDEENGGPRTKPQETEAEEALWASVRRGSGCRVRRKP